MVKNTKMKNIEDNLKFKELEFWKYAGKKESDINELIKIYNCYKTMRHHYDKMGFDITIKSVHKLNLMKDYINLKHSIIKGVSYFR